MNTHKPLPKWLQDAIDTGNAPAWYVEQTAEPRELTDDEKYQVEINNRDRVRFSAEAARMDARGRMHERKAAKYARRAK